MSGQCTAKTRIVGLVERDGRARAHVIPDLTGPTLKAAVRAHVDPSARLMTDENHAYFGLGKEFAGGHEVVNHGKANMRAAMPQRIRSKDFSGCSSAA